MQRREFLLSSAGVALATALPVGGAWAETRDSVRILDELAPNTHDPHGDGVLKPSYAVFTNVYDRLINFDRTALSKDVYLYDYSHFKGELAESFEMLEGGKTILFHLRRKATFHDGSPVTAEDVRYSLTRAVSMPSSKRQLATGSMTDPAQFVVVDDHTFRIDLPRPDAYTLPNLALTFASILNSKLVQAHATPADPWSAEWLRSNAAGGGAYEIADWQAGQQILYRRFDQWKSGPLPKIAQALSQFVAASESRMAALQKGDGDIVLQIPPKDIDSLSKAPGVRVVDIPVSTTFRFIAFNTQTAPFNDARVRQAIAYALPYDDLFQVAAAGHGKPLWGGHAPEPKTATFPQAYPYSTDIKKARALLGEAGLGGGFTTTFSHSVADTTVAAPIALLVQQALAAIGITVTIETVPAADWGTRLTQKTVPFYVETSSAWFNAPDYFFRIFFQGDWRWNFGSFKSPELAALVDSARWETDPVRYDATLKQAIALVFREVPLMPLWLPSFAAGVAPALRGFTYYIHGQVDLRPLEWV